ncbi:hypothetical protein [Luteipulveratus mongoliensis]|uniref:Uncharacterized protein n=1 Tax=Luteipulveratus mongoliensis TaxID=571913 RepID=A0A0K1JLL0_9MICO|nr:hypothetical protein [Luteipulveratus mongoliensis]AKU17601.1 hypothetical protein VV02_20060 [Luteipulveratus mongoliensis]
MAVLLLYVGICVVPAAIFWLLDRCYHAWTGVRPWPWSEPARDIEPSRPSSHLPLERLVADLHRLELEIARLERSDMPAKVHRLEAVTLAYDDTLRACCVILELPAPPARRLAGVDRLVVEAELAQAGLLW